jgi:zinc transporter ZupT
MLFLVVSEMIPESRDGAGQRMSSAIASVSGFLAMMVLQNILVFS